MRRAFAITLLCALLGVSPATAIAAGAGHIEGVVTPTAIAPEVEVCLVEAHPSETCDSPRADGSYVLSGLPVGPPLKIEFLPSHRSGYLPQYFDHAPRLDLAQSIVLPSGSPSEEVVKNVDADLEPGGAIEGTVTATSGGRALREVEVCASETGTKVPHGCTQTDSLGHYLLGSLPTGNYTVSFWGRGASVEFAPRFYDEANDSVGAAPVSVTAGGTVAGIDAQLSLGAQIDGSVAAAEDGAPLGGISVCLFAADTPTPTQCTYTGPIGTYSLFGIPAGTYQVGFALDPATIGGEAASQEADGYLTQYYDGVALRSAAVSLILTGAEVDSGIDAHLLAPAVPASPPVPGPISGSLVAVQPIVAEPVTTTPSRCRRGYVRRKVKGHYRCLKSAGGKGKGKSKTHHRRHRHRGI